MKRKILSLLLAAAMLMSLMAGLSGCGFGNQSKTPGTQKAETFTVEDGQTALTSEDGAAIDFGCLLEAGEELTIQKVSPTSIDSDVEIYAYDFKLSSGQPEGTVELTIPYDDAGLGANEELLSVCGKYLNEQSGQWEDVLYTVDAEANKVHILTDHLSTYSVFKVTNAGKRSEYISDVNVYAVRRGSFSSLLPFDNYTRRTVPLGGVYSLDLETERTYVLASLRLAQELFSHPGRVSGLVVRLREGADAEQVRRALARLSGDDYRVRTRHELRASFYRIMTYEKWGIFFISLLVLVIASFSVVGALAMLIVDKRRDIVTLRALGADTSLVRAIFRSEGLLICGLGAACGALLGVGLSLLQQHFGLIEIPAETLLAKSYPVEFRPGDLLAVLVAFGLVAYVISNITVRSMVKHNA